MPLFILKNNKAQVVAFDIVMATTLFIIIFSFFIVEINENIFETINGNNLREIKIRAKLLADILFESGGLPEDWQNKENNIEEIGIAKYPLVISEEKLNKFLDMDYNRIKEIMDIQRYEFYFRLGGKTKGLRPNENSVVVREVRIVEYDKNIYEGEFILWAEY
ncbi:MAG: hypothetical protein N3D73_02195 [Candidatus Diapherotrites archaeon]|nr:hypothetical protein [Candidatus Diapherotrites archaeon]